MSSKLSNKKVASNLIISVTAQAVSIITSFVLGFIVPKFIDELQYSYWQIYVLYVGYTGVLQFGLLDGIVLRCSQYDYDELDKPRIRSQFQLLLGFTSAVMIVGCIISACIYDNITKEVIILVAVGVVTKNVFGYTSYTFQITNRISKYAILVIAQRAAYAVFVCILLILKVNDFYWYCIADLFGDIFGTALGAIFNKGMYFGKGLPIRECFREAWANISAGIMLMIANLSSSLLVGGAKMVVQWRWDELIFGKVSFSFSVSSIFLTFVTAISVVLFPSLKRMNEEELPEVYKKIRDIISPLLFFVMILYFPGCWILEKWLPAYSESLVYLGILLPIIIFSTKVSLLTNNYLKAYRKEKLMLLINVLSVVVGLILFLVGAYALNDLEFVLYAVVFVVMLRSVVSEVVVMKIVRKRLYSDFFMEFLMTLIFILAVRFFDLWWACLCYAGALIVYGILYRERLLLIIRQIGNLFHRQKPVSDSNMLATENLYGEEHTENIREDNLSDSAQHAEHERDHSRDN